MQVPVYVTTAAGLETFTITSNAAVVNFELQTESEPLLLEIDPEFDLFRLLDPRETAPSIGQIFGEQDILALLPSAASAETQAAYRELAESWQSDAHGIDIRLDTELEELPADRAAWFFGAENLWVPRLFGGEDAQELELGDDQFVAAGQPIPFAGHSAVIVRRHPGNQGKAIGLINVESRRGLRRRIVETAALRKVFVPWFRGCRADQYSQRRVGGHRFAVAGRSEVTVCTRHGARRRGIA